MDTKEYQAMFAAEDRHWWYRGMQRITASLLSQFYSDRRNLRILDAGCGTGGAMQFLSTFGPVAGCDLSLLALEFCRQRNMRVLSQATVELLPFRDQEFDLVTSLDVLYHRAVKEHFQAMLEFHRVLKPGGRVFIRLAAYDWLRGKHDQAVHTAHRFTVGEVRKELLAAGFTVEKASYANTILFPLAVIERLLESRLSTGKERSALELRASWLNEFLTRVLYVEAAWLRRYTLPWGLSVVAVGRKRHPSGHPPTMATG